MRRGWFARALRGDLVKKLDTGGLFEVADEGEAQARVDRREITCTGPIYGARMRWAGGTPGDLEHEVLDRSGVAVAVLARARLAGSRRAARIFVEEVSIEVEGDGLRLAFRLPKGAYATNVLREMRKVGGEGRREGEAGPADD